MGDRGAAVCRFGWQCKRANCWFQHPQGRQIDQGGNNPQETVYLQPANGNGAGNGGPQFVYHGQNMDGQGVQQAGGYPGMGAPGYYYPPMQGPAAGYGGHPQSPVYLQPGQTAATSAPGQQSREPDEPQDEEYMGECPCCAGNPYDCPSSVCRARGFCGCMFGYEDNGCYEEEDDTWKDEWFPDSRSCTCCNGYIYRCEKRDVLCQSGACECSHVKGKNSTDEPNAGAESSESSEATAAALAALDLNAKA